MWRVCSFLRRAPYHLPHSLCFLAFLVLLRPVTSTVAVNSYVSHYIAPDTDCSSFVHSYQHYFGHSSSLSFPCISCLVFSFRCVTLCCFCPVASAVVFAFHIALPVMLVDLPSVSFLSAILRSLLIQTPTERDRDASYQWRGRVRTHGDR